MPALRGGQASAVCCVLKIDYIAKVPAFLPQPTHPPIIANKTSFDQILFFPFIRSTKNQKECLFVCLFFFVPFVLIITQA
jgi:hypothetical protein